MRKLLLIFVFTVFSLNVKASINEVYLDLNTGEKHEYKTSETKIKDLNVKDEENDEDYIYRPLKYIKEEFKELYFPKDKNKI